MLRTIPYGFTMIELIMVIIILGVLSAVAIPRFADFGSNARVAALQGVAANLRTAIKITQAQALIDEDVNVSAATDTVDLHGGVTINLVYGYPSVAHATSPGILVASDLPLGDLDSDGKSFESGEYTYANSGGVLQIYPTGFSACVVTYTEAVDADTAAFVDDSAITPANCGG